MVRLHVKKGNESQFLYETTVAIGTDELIKDLLAVYHGRLKILRICSGTLYSTIITYANV